jgi:hypothetical protein
MQTGARKSVGRKSCLKRDYPTNGGRSMGGLTKVRAQLAKGSFESLGQNPSLSDDRHEV